MRCKLSFIVPVYNVEQYLRKCVDSLLAQDYEDYEIILVDDGSIDESGAICDEYSQLKIEDRRLKISVIHQQNGGLSAARNAGIKAARGSFVCFLDSDDYWLPNKLGALMKQIDEEHLDILRFDYQNVKRSIDGQYEIFQPNKAPHYVDKRCDVVDGVTYLNERMGYACYVAQFVINREFLALFTPGIHFEDVDWLPRMMLNAKRVNSTETIVYSYLHRPGSITQTEGVIEKVRKNIEDRLLVIDTLTSLTVTHAQNKWLRNMIGMLTASILSDVAQNLYPERRDYIQGLRDKDVFPLVIADQGKTYRRWAKLINTLGPNMFCVIKHYL